MVKPELTPSSHNAKDLVGTWALVSVVAERDGRKFDSYDPNAKGLLVFDAIGRYSMILIAAYPTSRRVTGPAVRRMKTRRL
jgi:hypothetical protein